MIGQQIMNAQVGVIGKELFHLGSFMPGSIVRVNYVNLLNAFTIETGHGVHRVPAICIRQWFDAYLQ